MRKIYAFMLFAVLSLAAYADTDDNYYWFYDKVEAAPTGKGVIYASSDEEPTSDSDYAASKEVKFNVYGMSSSLLNVWAKPAAGYQFVGWFALDADMTVNDLTMEYLESADAESQLTVFAAQNSADADTEHYGFEPDATYYGLFAKVKVQAAKGLEEAGTVSISKIANDTGDEVTIEALPADEGIDFAYWLNSKGEKITQNPYKFTVGEMDTYTAYFTGDKILEIDFGEGKYIPFSNKLSGLIGDLEGYRIVEASKVFYDDDNHAIEFDETKNAWGYWDIKEEYDAESDTYVEVSREFIEYTGEIPTFDSSYKVSSFGYNYIGTDGVILYGEGKHFVVLYEDEDSQPWEGSFMVGTSGGSLDLGSLSPYDLDGTTPLNYYVFDGQDFVKTKTGVVPENQCYLVLDGNQYPLPDKIVFASSEAVGVEEVPTAQPVQFEGIYTIDGKQVTAPVKGLNIIGNRKVWVNQ
jgi:hypothetical protein